MPSTSTNSTYGPGGATLPFGGVSTVSVCAVRPATHPLASRTNARWPMCKLCVTKPLQCSTTENTAVDAASGVLKVTVNGVPFAVRESVEMVMPVGRRAALVPERYGGV